MAAAKRKKAKKKVSKKNSPTFKLKRNVRMDALNPAKIPRVRKELVEVDYLNQLNADELKWLAQFTDEYVSASIQKDKSGRVKSGHIHSTKELAKDCYDMNNKRNNDVHSVTRANNLLYNIDEVLLEKDGFYVNNPELTEDSAIKNIDDEGEEILTFDEYQKLKNNLTEDVREFYEQYYAGKLK
jgi:hypothetical protein